MRAGDPQPGGDLRFVEFVHIMQPGTLKQQLHLALTGDLKWHPTPPVSRVQEKNSDLLILTLKITQPVNFHNNDFLGGDASQRGMRCAAAWARQQAPWRTRRRPVRRSASAASAGVSQAATQLHLGANSGSKERRACQNDGARPEGRGHTRLHAEADQHPRWSLM